MMNVIALNEIIESIKCIYYSYFTEQFFYLYQNTYIPASAGQYLSTFLYLKMYLNYIRYIPCI